VPAAAHRKADLKGRLRVTKLGRRKKLMAAIRTLGWRGVRHAAAGPSAAPDAPPAEVCSRARTVWGGRVDSYVCYEFVVHHYRRHCHHQVLASWLNVTHAFAPGEISRLRARIARGEPVHIQNALRADKVRRRRSRASSRRLVSALGATLRWPIVGSPRAQSRPCPSS
jgi:hypothetical protein